MVSTIHTNCRPVSRRAGDPARLLVVLTAIALALPAQAAGGDKRRAQAGARVETQTMHSLGSQPMSEEIDMFVGETRSLTMPRLQRVAVGNGQTISATAIDDREVLVFANAVGTSALHVWGRDGKVQRLKINVLPGESGRIQREVAQFLASIPNTRATVVGDKVIVEGDNLSDIDQDKIAEIAKRYPQVVNFTGRVGWEKMVVMEVKVVEFPTNELREIGLKWNGSPSGGVQAGAVYYPLLRGGPFENSTAGGGLNFASGVIGSGLNAIAGFNSLFQAQINVLAQDGRATVLAQPMLSVRNGSTASFFAGGELPFQTSSATGTPSTAFKPYGVKLEITPRVDRSGAIRAIIETEVSSIDTALSLATGPALKTRRTKTEFNVQNGETMVLSGFITREMTSDINKVPGLGDIPVLGALFRSKRFQNRETELAIFVTPVLMDTRSQALASNTERIQNRLREDFGQTSLLVPAESRGVPRPVQATAPQSERTSRAVAAAPETAVPPTAPAEVGLLPKLTTWMSNRRGGDVRTARSEPAVPARGQTQAQPDQQAPLQPRPQPAMPATMFAPAPTINPAPVQAPAPMEAAPQAMLTRPAPSARSFVETVAPGAIAGDGTYRTVREWVSPRVSPGEDAQVVGHLSRGAKVVGSGRSSGQWLEIVVGNVYGWVHESWIEPVR